MINIEINNQLLDLYPNTEINYYLTNPMFSDIGNFTLPLKIANNKSNRIKLNFPGRISNINNNIADYEASIQARSLKLRGLLSVKETSNEEFDAYYTDGIGEFNYLVENKYLTDISADDYEWDTKNEMDAYLRDTINHIYPDRDFVCFPVQNINLFDGTSGEDEWKAHYNSINAWDWTTSNFRTAWQYHIPFFYISYIIEKLFNTFGYIMGRNPFRTIAEFRRLIVYFPCFRRINNISIWNEYYRQEDGKFKINLVNYTSKYPILDFIKGIENAFCCKFFINNTTKVVDIKFWKEILSSGDYEDITGKASEEFTVINDDELNGYNLSYNFDSNDESTSLKDIDNYIRIDDVNSYDDLPSYSSEEDIDHIFELCFVQNENSFYIYYKKTGESIYDWYKLSEHLYELKSGDGDFEIASEISPLRLMINEGSESVLMPFQELSAINEPDYPFEDMDNIGFFPLSDDMYKVLNPRFLFYRGIFSTLSQKQYPFASNHVYYKNISGDHDYSKINNANYALSWEGPYGLYESFWKEYLYWYINFRKPVKRYIHWKAEDIQNIDYSKKYRIGNHDYFIKSIPVKINTSGYMELEETELIKV